ncbi:MAG: TPM domain-containing protein [Nitrospirae bacterium]|nr:TPM domain-containing protein [Nitrospirota bacterium]
MNGETTRTFRNILNLLTLLASIILVANIAAATNVPFLTGRITDNAETLSEPMRKSLTERLKAHEESTGNQIAVLTVSSLEGQSIEEYAEAVFREWKLGQKGKDNGILVVVALKDRRMRIEVGYGLEGTLTDLMAGRIIQNIITPKFKTGDYDGGVEAGVGAIITLLENGKTPELESSLGGETKTSTTSGLEAPPMPLTQRILFGAFIFGIIGLFTVIGIMTPGMGWFLYFFLIPFWAMFPIVIVGTSGALYMLITYLIVYPLAKLLLSKTAWYAKAAADMRTKGHATIGGFSLSSGSSGGSWSSGSSGSSGFSGGGGSSGGGGASGSW